MSAFDSWPHVPGVPLEPHIEQEHILRHVAADRIYTAKWSPSTGWKDVDRPYAVPIDFAYMGILVTRDAVKQRRLEALKRAADFLLTKMTGYACMVPFIKVAVEWRHNGQPDMARIPGHIFVQQLKEDYEQEARLEKLK